MICPTSEMLQNPSKLKKLRVEGILKVRDVVRWWPALRHVPKTYKSLRISTGQLPTLKIDYFRRLIWPGLKSVKIEAYEIDDFKGLLDELLHVQEIEIRVETLTIFFDEFCSQINSFLDSKPSSTTFFDCILKNHRIFLSDGKLKFCNYGVVHLPDPRVFHRYIRSLTH